MKLPGTVKLLLATGLLTGAVASADAAVMINRAVVRAVRGTADYSVGKSAQWKPVKVGAVYNPSTVIRTAPDSSVDLFLGDNGPVVRITPDTQLGIDKLSLEDTGMDKVIDTELDLRNGRILGNVKKMAAASKYEVKTPLGVAGIRGTEYDISANGTVHVISGEVVVVYITPGGAQTVRATTGQTVLPPEPNQPARQVPTTQAPTQPMQPPTLAPGPNIPIQTTPGTPAIVVVVPTVPVTQGTIEAAKGSDVEPGHH